MAEGELWFQIGDKARVIQPICRADGRGHVVFGDIVTIWGAREPRNGTQIVAIKDKNNRIYTDILYGQTSGPITPHERTRT